MALNRNRVAILTTDLYKGGVSESTRKMVSVLSEEFDVDLIVYDNTPILIKTEAKREIFLNLPLASNFAKTPFGRILKKIFRLPCLILAILYMIYYRLKYKPTVIYSMMYIPNLVNIISSLFFKCIKAKIVISERQDPRMDLNEKSLISKVLKIFYPKADVIHANSYPMINAISEYYNVEKEKIFHLDNFFFLDEVKEKAKEKIEDEYKSIFEKKVIITSGRLSKQKGHWHLLYLFSLLNKNDYNLVILGDGELQEYLSDLSVSLEVSDNVFFLGNVKNPHKFINASYLFIFPSIWESFGNSLIEAMALGKPVISTSCKSGPDYIINKGEYGIDIGTLSSYEEFQCDVNNEKLLSAVELFNDNVVYKKYSNLSQIRAGYFDVKNNKITLLNLFESKI